MFDDRHLREACLPVILTPFGARVLHVRSRGHTVLAEVGGFVAAIPGLQAEPDSKIETRRERTRTHVGNHFDWDVIAEQFQVERRGRKLP
jgi:hypothetical protein